MKPVFVTSNAGKLADVQAILNMELSHEEIDLPEIQSMDRHEIAREKAREAYIRLKKPLFIVDTSLSFKALNGFPGPLIKWFWKTVGEEVCSIINCLGEREVSAIITIGYADENGIRIFDGETRGMVSKTPRGRNGFAWDTIFIPSGHERTFAEMTSEEKRAIFSGNPAWKEFKEFIKSIH